MLKKILLFILIILPISIGCYLLGLSAGKVSPIEPVSAAQGEVLGSSVNETPQESAPQPKLQYSLDDPSSLWVMPNKSRPLPLSYQPSDLIVPNIPLRGSRSAENMQVSAVMAANLQAMQQTMVSQGMNIALVSGFRSSQTQTALYNNYVAQYGQAEADRFSARPGTSEHQTGLAIDVGLADGAYELEQSFGDTREGRWIAAHAHEYGFIVRYPEGKEDVVGYMYEPWHLRYVGQELATDLFNQNKTMEEYFLQ